MAREQQVPSGKSAVMSDEDPRVATALDWCRERGFDDLTVAIPCPASPLALTQLLARAEVRSLVVNESLPPGVPDERVGNFLPGDYSWELPRRLGSRILYIGDRSTISARMIRVCLRRRVRSVIHWDVDWWVASPVPLLAGQKLYSKLLSAVGRAGTAFGVGRLVPRVSRVIDAAYRRKFAQVLDAAPRHASEPAIPRRVVIACPTLVAGGAERQIVNTALGLVERGVTDVIVLVSNLHSRPGHDFFLDELVSRGVSVREVTGPTDSLEEWEHFRNPELLRLAYRMRAILQGLPGHMLQEFVDVFFMLRELRPAVVHAWLDHSNMSAGLAALLARVPRIIVSGRNVSPIHFPYILQPYMRAGYQVLASQPDVAFVNNSLGGAEDYADWLGLPMSRFSVVYNGLRLDSRMRSASGAVAEFRRKYAIPPDGLLVGGMFRFSDEKRPLLWLDTAKRLASIRSDVRFLLFGEGPRHAEMRHFLDQADISSRVRLEPPTAESALALSSFDVTLLTSQWEGTPNVAIESQALGTPVVLTGGGGASEAVANGITGLFVAQASGEALAGAVNDLLSDPARRQRMGEAGPGFVRDRFDMERMIRETLALYGMT